MRLTKFAAIAGTLAVPLAFAAPAHASGATGSAFGISASGLVPIPATPSVTSEHPPSHKALLELPPNKLIDLGILRTDAHPGQARASVLDLRIAMAKLSAHVITATCHKGRGSSHLVQASLAGHKLAVDAAPNSELSVPVSGVGKVSVVLNKQVHTPGGGLSVTAIQLSVPLVTGAETVSISNATCSGRSHGTPSQPPSESPTPPPNQGGEAPAPTPVPSNLPVTG